MIKDDLIRMRHMLDAAAEAVELSAGKSKQDIQNERLLNLSLVRLMEVLGEAAYHVSQEARGKYPTIPWLQIIGCVSALSMVTITLTSIFFIKRLPRICHR